MRGSRLLVQESIYEPLLSKLKRRMATPASATRSTRTPMWARSTRSSSSRGSPNWWRRGKDEGAEIYQPPCRLPEKGLVVRPDRVYERGPELPDRPGGDLRPGALRADVPHAGRGRRGRPTTPPYGLSAGVWTEKGSRIPRMGRAAERRCRWAEHLQPPRPDLPVRRLQGIGLRSRRRPPRGSSRTWGSTNDPNQPAARAEDLQALHRRRLPAVRVWADLRGRRSERRSRLPQGARDAVRAARSALPAWPGRPPTTAVRCSTDSRR